jgi:hypothetical protein
MQAISNNNLSYGFEIKELALIVFLEGWFIGFLDGWEGTENPVNTDLTIH